MEKQVSTLEDDAEGTLSDLLANAVMYANDVCSCGRGVRVRHLNKGETGREGRKEGEEEEEGEGGEGDEGVEAKAEAGASASARSGCLELENREGETQKIDAHGH